VNLHDLISIGGAVLSLLSVGAVWGSLRQRVTHLENAEKKRNGRAEGALGEKVDRHELEIQSLRKWRHDIGDTAAETVAAAELVKRGLSVPPPRRRG
jgi:hypothetical protein